MKKKTATKQRNRQERLLPEGRAGYGIREYFPHLVGFGSQASWYQMEEAARPKHFRVGRRILITERPADYLARLEQLSRERPIKLQHAA